jgi:uncharacterized membrane protein
MFEWLFKYPPAAFSEGKFVFLSGWPGWLLPLLVVLVAGGIAYRVWQTKSSFVPLSNLKRVLVWLLQTAFLAVLLLMLWRPALSLAALQEKQNAIAVLVDTSQSMTTAENGTARIDKVNQALQSSAFQKMREKYQVRLFSFDQNVLRANPKEALMAGGSSTRIADSIASVFRQERGVPMGAVVVISDGSENNGGIGQVQMDEIRRQRIPIHTVGVGDPTPQKDIEVEAVSAPAQSLKRSRFALYLSFSQQGFDGQKANLLVKDNGAVIAGKEIVLKPGRQTETLMVKAGDPGIRVLEASVEPLADEQNRNNNRSTHVLDVKEEKRRLLYLEGDPRWEMKFIRRALDLDDTIELASALKTTQNKVYRQGVSGPEELKDGFPTSVEELFSYEGVIIGSIEANSLTAAQQTLLREFVDRRGGGLLFIAGRQSFSESGWHKSSMAELFPVVMADRKGTFSRSLVNAKLAAAGVESPITRLVDGLDENIRLWNSLPQINDFQSLGQAKPGAEVLLTGPQNQPLLVTHTYGRGRVGALASGGTWRWQMQLDHQDLTHETFWQQLSRWLVSETPNRVQLNVSQRLLRDTGAMELRAEVRDKNYQLTSESTVNAEITKPDGQLDLIKLQADPQTAGNYSARYELTSPGSYLVKASAVSGDQLVGQHAITVRREDGVAEAFHRYLNQELLQRLSTATGGRYYPISDFARLTEEVTYSESGISLRESRDLWDMPVMFLLATILRGAEWLLRRRWGVV